MTHQSYHVCFQCNVHTKIGTRSHSPLNSVTTALSLLVQKSYNLNVSMFMAVSETLANALRFITCPLTYFLDEHCFTSFVICSHAILHYCNSISEKSDGCSSVSLMMCVSNFFIMSAWPSCPNKASNLSFLHFLFAFHHYSYHPCLSSLAVHTVTMAFITCRFLLFCAQLGACSFG